MQTTFPVPPKGCSASLQKSQVKDRLQARDSFEPHCLCHIVFLPSCLVREHLKQTNTTRPRKVQHKAYGTWHKPKYLSVSQKFSVVCLVFSSTVFFIFTVRYKYLKSNVNHEDVAAIKIRAKPCFTPDREGNKEATTSALPTTRTTLLVADVGHAFRTPCKQQDKVQRLEASRL